MLERLRGLMPSAQTLAANPWLRWLGPALHHPRLWHMSRRGIAMGCAIGVFFGLLIPIAQIPFAAAFAVALRANVPSAVASTLVTNPVTFGPVYYAAWAVGNRLLGEPDDAVPAPAALAAAQAATATHAPADQGWIARTWGQVSNVGKPLMLGLALFASAFGVGVWLLVHLLWRLHVHLKRRRRRRA